MNVLLKTYFSSLLRNRFDSLGIRLLFQGWYLIIEQLYPEFIISKIFLTSVPSIAPIAEASVVGMESSFTDSIASELRFPSIWWWPPPLVNTRTSSNWCLEPSRTWIQTLGGMLGLGLAIVGEDAVCPTEDEVTCKIDAAEDETNPTQSVVGDSAGLVACELWFEKGKHNN